jgi:hypothetical protein
LCWFLGLGVLLAAVRMRTRGSSFFGSPASLAITAFVTAMTLIYLAAFGWYAVIGNGERFTLMLYLPLLSALAWCAYALARDLPSRWQVVYAAAVSVVLAHASLQTMLLLAYPYFAEPL